MSADVTQYVKTCSICNHKNTFRPKHRETLQQLTPIPYEMGNRIHLDLLGMPKLHAGHVAICTLVDAATRFIITNPIFKKTSLGVVDSLMNKCIPYFGCPIPLVTDKGKENVNSKLSLLYEIF